MDTSQDHRCRRCPRLGHEVAFAYCRCMPEGRACPRVLDCWWEIFDVQGYLRANLPGEEFQTLVEKRPPKPKVISLIELIEQAKRRADRKG